MVQAIARNDAQVRRLAGDLVTQFRATAAWLKTLEASDFEASCHDRTVRDHLGHLLFLGTDLHQTLGQATTLRPVSLAAHLRTLGQARTMTHDLTQRTTGEETGAALLKQLLLVCQDVERQLDDQLPPVVETLFEPVRTADVLKRHLIEMVLVSDDLSLALPARTPCPLERGALFTAVRTLAELLAEARPGKSVEVRVPPAVAVQIASPDGDGPTHTRGTPPTVVEMTPVVWLRLATGRLTWADAVATHTLAASGIHADLTPYLPVTRL